MAHGARLHGCRDPCVPDRDLEPEAGESQQQQAKPSRSGRNIRSLHRALKSGIRTTPTDPARSKEASGAVSLGGRGAEGDSTATFTIGRRAHE